MAKHNLGSRLDTLNRDHDWLSRQDLSQYVGQWIAVAGRSIVAYDRDLALLKKKVQSLALDGKPLVVQVPAHPIVA